jgi:tight adherence protein B
MIRRSLVRSSAAAAVCALTLLTAPVHAKGEVSIDHVTTEGGEVSVLLSVDGLPRGETPDTDSILASVNGEDVDAVATPVKGGEVDRITILVIDASKSMAGERIESAKTAARAFLEAAPSDVQIGLITFADGVQDTTMPTTDHDRVAVAVDAIELSQQTYVYDALDQAIDLAGTEGARSILLLSDGADTGSEASLQSVVGAAERSELKVDVVSLDQSAQAEARLGRIADASGGTVVDADTKALAQVFSAQADALASQLLLSFSSPLASEAEATVEVTLTAGDQTYGDSAFVTMPGAGVGPRLVDAGESLVSRPLMLLGALGLALGLAGVLAIVLVGDRGPSSSERRLSAYFGEGAGQSAPGSDRSLKDSAVSVTSKVVNGDFETRITQRLNGAGSSLTAAEWILLHAAVTVGSAFIGFVLGGVPLTILMLLLGLTAPWLYLRFRHSRRLAKFNAQMPETLGLMAGGLQAGLSLPQAIDTVIREGHEPIAGELRRALMEQRLGVDITDALDGVAHRMESDDFSWVVMAVRIQREVGGNLAEILTTVADTLREREYLRRQVKALSAEGRLSGYILTGLPPLIFAYMLFANPDYVRPLYTTGVGFVIMGLAGVLLAIGGFAMSRLAKVEV